MDIILNRRSIRKYDLNKKISDELLIDLCRYAEAAPSARNQRGRAYIIINDSKTIKALSEVSQGSRILANANTCICVVGKDKNELSTPAMQPTDLAAATENILLRATEQGLASCWIGLYPMSDRMEATARILNIPANEFAFSLIALGYPEGDNVFYDMEKKPEISFNRR